MASRPKGGAPNRRGSPEAIAKRRAGRAFNLLLDAGAGRGLDGRSQKRRQRLLRELASGRARGARGPLKPLDLLSKLEELLQLGEPAQSLRRVCRPLSTPRDEGALVRAVAELHRAYGFRPDAYRLAGLPEAVLHQAGVAASGSVAGPPDPRGPRRRGLPGPTRRA